MASLQTFADAIFRTDLGSWPLVVGSVIMISSVAPHTERALLLGNDGPPPAKALTAVVQTQVVPQSQPALRPSQAVQATPQLARTAAPAALQSPAALDPIVSAFEPISAPPIQPAAITPFTGPIPTTSEFPIGTPRLPAAADAAPVLAAVPEPATWAMMILGFFAIGVSIRTRPSAGRRSRSALPVA